MSESEHEGFRFATRRNSLLFLASFFVAAGMGGGGWPVVVAGEFIFVLLVVQHLWDQHALSHIRVRRRHVPRTFEKEFVTLRIQVDNNARHEGAHMLTLRDSFHAASPSEVLCQKAHLAPGEQTTFRCIQKVSRRRGLHVVGPVRLTARDSMGLFTYRRTVDLLSRITVVPKPVRAPHVPMLQKGTSPNVGRDVRPRLGRSEEFRGLRPYRSGDAPRLIHWPSSARQGRLLVKEFDTAFETDVWIYVDLFLYGITGLGDQSSSEWRLALAASLAAEASRRHHRFRVIAAREERDETTLGHGKRHLVTTLDWLGILKPQGTGSLESELAADVPRIRRGSTVCLVVSSLLVRVERLLPLLALLRQRRVDCLVFVTEDRDFPKLRTEQDLLWHRGKSAEEITHYLETHGFASYTIRLGGPISDTIRAMGLPLHTIHAGAR